MRQVYKKPKTVKEQVEYLKQNKKVVFNSISEEDAEKILYEHCYINVITPYKHRFAEIDRSTGLPARDAKNNHIYNHDTEFNDYYKTYDNERRKYPKIYKNIMMFETTFNSIVANEVLTTYGIDSFDSFMKFRDQLMINVSMMKLTEPLRDRMRDEINGFYNTMKRYDDIFIFMDRLSLSQVITIYRCVDQGVHDRIFQGLCNANVTFGYSSPGTFDDFLKRIVPIRNCICHFNSLEILTNYYDIKTKQLRTITDRKKFQKVIAKLSK